MLDEENRMKIYFAGSIRVGHADVCHYHRLVEYLRKDHTVLTRHMSDLSVKEGATDEKIYSQDTAWLRESDIVIAECTRPSLGVGYELAYAERYGKEIHIFYNRNRGLLSTMLSGDDNFHIHPYSHEDEIYPILDSIFKGQQESGNEEADKSSSVFPAGRSLG